MPNRWLGIMTGPGVVGLAVVFLYYISSVIGTDYLMLKAALIGAFTQALIMSTRTLFSNYQIPTVSHFVHASASALAGVLAGFLVKKYLLNEKEPRGIKKEQSFNLRPMSTFKPFKENEKQFKRFRTPKKL